MTRFWDIRVESPADLPPLADALEEAGARRWAVIVSGRHLEETTT